MVSEKDKLAQVLWKKCIEAVKAADGQLEIPDDLADWETFLEKINHSLDGLNFELKHMQDEHTGRLMYALVNVQGDEIAQLATEYTPVEIMFFKAIVELIMLAPNESFTVSSMAALREVNLLPNKANMTKSQAEVVLGSFVAKGWLRKSRKGRYSLATRALIELQPLLKSTYADEFLECTICMEIVTRGVACRTANCKARLHNHCFERYRRGNCPTCKGPWPQEKKDLVQVGEGAYKPGQDDAGDRARRKSRAEESDEEDQLEPELEDEGEGDDGNATQQNHTQSQSKSQENQSQMGDGDSDEQPAPPKPKRKGRR